MYEMIQNSSITHVKDKNFKIYNIILERKTSNRVGCSFCTCDDILPPGIWIDRTT